MSTPEDFEGNPEAYLRFRVTEEQALLLHANEFRIGEQYYSNDRDDVASFARPEIELRIGNLKRVVRVLEIGGGQGKTVLRLIKDLPPGAPVEYSMTTLNPLPEHTALLEKGMQLFIPIAAEYLLAQWTAYFDVVITQCMLGWTKMDLSIPEIKRVLIPGGVWTGFETADARLLHANTLVGEAAQQWMLQNNMVNEMGWEAIYRYRKREEYYPLKWTKPMTVTE